MSGESPRGVGSRLAHDGRVVRLFIERVEFPGGVIHDLEIVRHPGASAVVPIDGDGNAVLLRQHRHATGGDLLEVPAGKLDPGESPEQCARRELEEEAGVSAKRWSPLGWIWTTPGFTDEKIWLYLAQDLEPSSQRLDPDESLVVVRVPFVEAVEMAASGEISDAKSAIAIWRASRSLR